MDEFIALIQSQLDTRGLEKELASLKPSTKIKVGIDTDYIKTQLESALSNISVSGSKINLNNLVNTGNIQKQAQSIGQSVGKAMSISAQKAVSDVQSKVIGNGFKVSKSMSQKVQGELENIVKKMTNGKGELSSVTIDTKTSFDKKTLENIEELKSATIQYKNELGEVITKTLKWQQIGTDQNAPKGKDVVMGWVEASARYKKGIEEASKVTDSFVNKQKKTATQLSNQVKQIYRSAVDQNSAKPIKEQSHLTDLENRYNIINSEISKLGGLSGGAFADQENYISSLITELKILKTEYKNAESAATALRSKPIEVVKDETLAKVQGLEADIRKVGVSSKELTTYMSDMNTALSSDVINRSGIDDVLNLYAKAKAELGKLKKESSADLSLEKAQIKVSGLMSEIKKVSLDNTGLDKFTSEIRGASVSVNSLLQDLSQVKTSDDVSVLTQKWQTFTNAAKEAGIIANNTSKDLAKINDSINSKSYDVQIASLTDKLTNYSSGSDQYKTVQKSLGDLVDAYNELKKAKDNYEKDSSLDNYTALTQKNDELISVMKRTGNEMKLLGIEQDKLLSSSTISSARKSFTSYFENNTKAAKIYKDEVADLRKQLGNMTTVADKAEYDTAFKNFQTKVIREGNTGKSRWSEIKRATKDIAAFTGIYGILQGIMQDVPRQVFQNINDVDDAMTSLRMATSVTNEEAKALMQTYSDMGKDLKTLGTDVATSSTEWMKQGKSIKEANELAKDSIVLSKIGDLSSEDATKTITAAMKSYDLQQNEIMDFIDKISAIDMASATDVGGLSQAFNEVAANAKIAGVEAEKLISYAAVIGETTQEGMASVGTSLNAIFSRMGNIKLSRLKDYENDGEDLSNVETVLKKNKIALRDAGGQFREFDDVLDETAAKWQNFDSVTRRAVANAFAGTHHANSFVVLMEQYEKAQEYMDIASNSSGQSMEKFQAYQESMTGSIEGFKNALQSLSTTAVDSGFLTGIINGGTATINILDSLIDKFGVLQSLFTVGGGIFASIKGLGKNVMPLSIRSGKIIAV